MHCVSFLIFLPCGSHGDNVACVAMGVLKVYKNAIGSVSLFVGSPQAATFRATLLG